MMKNGQILNPPPLPTFLVQHWSYQIHATKYSNNEKLSLLLIQIVPNKQTNQKQILKIIQWEEWDKERKREYKEHRRGLH